MKSDHLKAEFLGICINEYSRQDNSLLEGAVPHCRMFSSIPCFYSLDTSRTHWL